MTKPFSVVVDFDDVLFPTMNVVLHRFNNRHGTNFEIEDITQWDISEALNLSTGDQRRLYEIFAEPDLYESGYSFDYFQQVEWGIQKMVDFNWNVIFATAAYHQGKLPRVRLLKPGADIIVHPFKENIPADALVDDKLETIKAFGAGGILFDRPWNQEKVSTPTEYTRCFNWGEVIDNLVALEYEKDFEPSPPTEPWDVVINEDGGMQSRVDGRYDLIDPLATKVLAEVFAYGAKRYAPHNWRLIPTNDHVNHAVNHIMQYLASDLGLPHDETEDHLAHAMWRLHAAVAMREAKGQ